MTPRLHQRGLSPRRAIGRAPLRGFIVLTLSLIGIGCGDPEQLTLAAVRAINAADLILIPRKGEEKSDLAELRREICARVLTNAARRGWSSSICPRAMPSARIIAAASMTGTMPSPPCGRARSRRISAPSGRVALPDLGRSVAL